MIEDEIMILLGLVSHLKSRKDENINVSCSGGGTVGLAILCNFS